MYNLLYLAKGKLPWSRNSKGLLKVSTDDILTMKETQSADDLFEGLPCMIVFLIICSGVCGGF